MLIAHVNFTYPQGKLLSIPSQLSCIARGWGSGGVIDRCIITLRFIRNAHTPGFVLVTDITVTIAMTVHVPAINTYVKINMHMIVKAFGKIRCIEQLLTILMIDHFVLDKSDFRL